MRGRACCLLGANGVAGRALHASSVPLHRRKRNLWGV